MRTDQKNLFPLFSTAMAMNIPPVKKPKPSDGQSVSREEKYHIHMAMIIMQAIKNRAGSAFCGVFMRVTCSPVLGYNSHRLGSAKWFH